MEIYDVFVMLIVIFEVGRKEGGGERRDCEREFIDSIGWRNLGGPLSTSGETSEI
jgi:hypothetical protein